MTWALIGLLAAYSGWLHFRLWKLARDLRRLDAMHHEAGNHAIRRHGRDIWRRRQIVECLEVIVNWTETPVDVPDLVNGPPDDPDSG